MEAPDEQLPDGPYLRYGARWPSDAAVMRASNAMSSTGKGILIGMLSAFGSAALVSLVIALLYFLRNTRPGRILLDRMGRPGEYDDEEAFAKQEAEALEQMDDAQRMEYMRAKAFIEVNPPESVQTDISLSQFLAIQEKGVSAWEFEPELEIANCFVEGRTEIEFFDAECSVQSNLPLPKQNEVYYWEAKIYDKPESSLISIGVTTKPYPLFKLPGLHRYSIAYSSVGERRHNQPFRGQQYGPLYVQGDVVGVGYRPRTGTVFFTHNGKKLDDVAQGLKSHNFFPTVGANGPCHIHVNFGQLGFVFIEANVKKWGLAPMTGSLAPPPPYGSEQGSILLEGGRDRDSVATASASLSRGAYHGFFPNSLHAPHGRSGHAQVRLSTSQPPTSPGPHRSPTDISLAALSLIDTADGGQESAQQQHDQQRHNYHRNSPFPSIHSFTHGPLPHDDAGEGTSTAVHPGRPVRFDTQSTGLPSTGLGITPHQHQYLDPATYHYSHIMAEQQQQQQHQQQSQTQQQQLSEPPPPKYESPRSSPTEERQPDEQTVDEQRMDEADRLSQRSEEEDEDEEEAEIAGGVAGGHGQAQGQALPLSPAHRQRRRRHRHAHLAEDGDDRRPLLAGQRRRNSPPIPTYDAAMAESPPHRDDS